MHTVIRADLRANWDNGDAWASTMSAWFSIADVLYVTGEDIPNDWGYRQPATTDHVIANMCNDAAENGEWLATDLREAYYTRLVTADDLRHAGNILKRLSDILEANDRSY